MSEHEVLGLIRSADAAITAEDFDRLMEFYAEDAVLVIEPGRLARGKDQIRSAFVAIAKHFKNDLRVTQGAAQVIEGSVTALVIMETVLETPTSSEPILRRATYVFASGEEGRWLCTVDNSYGTDLLDIN